MSAAKVAVYNGGTWCIFDRTVAPITCRASGIGSALATHGFLRMRAALYAPESPDVAATPPD